MHIYYTIISKDLLHRVKKNLLKFVAVLCCLCPKCLRTDHAHSQIYICTRVCVRFFLYVCARCWFLHLALVMATNRTHQQQSISLSIYAQDARLKTGSRAAVHCRRLPRKYICMWCVRTYVFYILHSACACVLLTQWAPFRAMHTHNGEVSPHIWWCKANTHARDHATIVRH